MSPFPTGYPNTWQGREHFAQDHADECLEMWNAGIRPLSLIGRPWTVPAGWVREAIRFALNDPEWIAGPRDPNPQPWTGSRSRP